MRRAIVTTSWDDGHPLDFRVANLLNKYGLTGTFYIPSEAPYGVMSRSDIRELSKSFDIGAHTIHHTVLTEVPPDVARQEIADSKPFIEDLTGTECASFCFPKRKFRRAHLPMVREAGFVMGRTVEVLSLAQPVSMAGVLVMPTSVQAFSYSASGFVRNTVKRLAATGLYHWVRHCRKLDWVTIIECLLPLAAEQGGVSHLWGHSWEIDQNGEWDKLEQACELLGQYRRDADYLTNSQIARSALAVV